MNGAPILRVVIPTLDEASHLPSLLDDLGSLTIPASIVVVDGGSRDATADIATAAGATLLRAPRGRARQLNRGAAGSQSPWLLFLHADSRLDQAALTALEGWIGEARSQAAHFRFALQGRGWFWRFIEFGQGIRQRLYGLVYGDQGLLVTSALFERVGGYPNVPIMEDVALHRALRNVTRIGEIPAVLRTSPRRYEKEGRWFGWIRNSCLITLYLIGVAPQRLARWYGTSESGSLRDDSPGAPKRLRQLLLVFAKAPRPGYVKTRLAESVGPDEATRIYRELGRTVIDQVLGASYEVAVWYDPPDAEVEVMRWLNTPANERGIRFRPQEEGDLGHRLSEAFRRAFESADLVCAIGTDAPDVDRNLVTVAFEALSNHDVVLGPASDGGYYLIGLRKPLPGLFENMPWSTDQVFAITQERAIALGLSVHALRTLSDVDRLEDVPLSLR